MKKRLVSLCLSLCMMMTLAPAMAVENTDTNSNIEKQLQLIYDYSNLWYQWDGKRRDYTYAVADLDQNGLFEIIVGALVRNGAGASTLRVFEVNMADNKLLEIPIKYSTSNQNKSYNLDWYDQFVKDFYFDNKSGIFYYPIEDSWSYGMWENGFDMFLASKTGTKIDFSYLGEVERKRADWSNGKIISTYRDKNNREISEYEFNCLIDNQCKGFLEGTVNIGWENCDNKSKIMDMLSRSQNNFSISVGVERVLNFWDVFVADWFADDVKYAVEKGIMSGTSATTFSPNDSATRAQFATILYRLAGSPSVSGHSFSDVKAGEWYANAVEWAYQNGIVNGTGGGKFSPNGNVTREQLAVMFYRYAKAQNYDVSNRADLSEFTDLKEVSGDMTDALSWANAVGLITGTTGTTMNPKGNATRAQMAVILHRFCDHFFENVE